MSLSDTIFIFGLALIIFGPKKLPEIGRQLGKLMLEFRRASNEFKMQIDEELRAAEQSDRDKQYKAATPPPLIEPAPEALTLRPPADGLMVSTESPSSRVIPVHEEVAALEAAIGEHPELASGSLERLPESLPEQATVHND